jgi:hypothetical protein
MLPTFIIIGAMKSGTSSLYKYLAAHPEIGVSRVKETDFFLAERNYRRGLAWYESLFSKSGAREFGEASPNYTKRTVFAGVPERMHAVVPQARLVYILRDPVARMLSQYAHRYAQGTELRPLADALGPRDHNTYWLSSSYYFQLSAFLEHYPLERILVLQAEDLREDRPGTLRRVFQFLGIDSEFDCPLFRQNFNVSSRRYSNGWSLERLVGSRRMLHYMRSVVSCPLTKPARPAESFDAETRQRVEEFLRPDIEALRRLTGQKFERWCI